MENVLSEAPPIVASEKLEASATAEATAVAPAPPNRLANLWLLLLTVVLGLTAICTGVLVAWPVLAWLSTKLTEM